MLLEFPHNCASQQYPRCSAAAAGHSMKVYGKAAAAVAAAAAWQPNKLTIFVDIFSLLCILFLIPSICYDTSYTKPKH